MHPRQWYVAFARVSANCCGSFRWPRRLFRRLLGKPDDHLVHAIPLTAVHKPSQLIGLSSMITSVTTCTHLRVFPRFFLCYRLYFKNMPRERVSGEREQPLQHYFHGRCGTEAIDSEFDPFIQLGHVIGVGQDAEGRA